MLQCNKHKKRKIVRQQQIITLFKILETFQLNKLYNNHLEIMLQEVECMLIAAVQMGEEHRNRMCQLLHRNKKAKTTIIMQIVQILVKKE